MQRPQQMPLGQVWSKLGIYLDDRINSNEYYNHHAISELLFEIQCNSTKNNIGWLRTSHDDIWGQILAKNNLFAGKWPSYQEPTIDLYHSK